MREVKRGNPTAKALSSSLSWKALWLGGRGVYICWFCKYMPTQQLKAYIFTKGGAPPRRFHHRMSLSFLAHCIFSSLDVLTPFSSSDEPPVRPIVCWWTLLRLESGSGKGSGTGRPLSLRCFANLWLWLMTSWNMMMAVDTVGVRLREGF